MKNKMIIFTIFLILLIPNIIYANNEFDAVYKEIKEEKNAIEIVKTATSYSSTSSTPSKATNFKNNTGTFNMEFIVRLIIFILFITVYINMLPYYGNNQLSYVSPIIGSIFFVFQLISIFNSEITESGDIVSLIGYYLGYYTVSIVGLYITYIPIYKHKNNINSFFKHYNEILVEKDKTCSRSDYWVLFVLIFLSYLILSTLSLLFDNFVFRLYIMFLLIIDFIFQMKRLEDANLSKWFLLLRFIGLLSTPLFYVTYIVMLGILTLPSYSLPTTQIKQ